MDSGFLQKCTKRKQGMASGIGLSNVNDKYTAARFCGIITNSVV